MTKEKRYQTKEEQAQLRASVCKGATESELNFFIELVNSTGLDPFRKEIWFVKHNQNSPAQIMTGINGFLSIANSHPQFDGIVCEEIEKDGHLVAVRASAYRKDRKHPATAIAKMVEYRKGSPIWKQMPSVMLTKCAKSMALREAFPQELNGLYTAEEMPTEFSEPVNKPAKKAQKKAEASPTPAPQQAAKPADESAWKCTYDITDMSLEQKLDMDDLLKRFSDAGHKFDVRAEGKSDILYTSKPIKALEQRQVFFS